MSRPSRARPSPTALFPLPWKIPGKFSPGAGGGIELAQKARRVAVLTTHLDRAGSSKLKAACSLPITARACVSRIFTDLAVIDVTPAGFALRERAEGVTVDEIVDATDAPLALHAGTIPTF
jgi:3-oxoacid CoA-transferase subunit B